MTGILQVLDVVLNRFFQQFYGCIYNQWLTKNFNNPSYQTPTGNMKSPSYVEVTNWISKFADGDYMKK